MGSDSSKHASARECREIKAKNRRTSFPERQQSLASPGKITNPPVIRVGTSASCNDGFLSIGKFQFLSKKKLNFRFLVNKNMQTDRPDWNRNRNGSASSDRSSSIRRKHPVPLRYQQLIQSCFLNPHEVVGRKILKRTAEMRLDFAKFYVTMSSEQREEVEESIKFLLKKTVCNIDFLDEVRVRLIYS